MRPSKYRTFLIFGAPGCGKGTQGSIIAHIPRFHYFSCGDAFRALEARSPLGQKFVEYSSKGQLVPDEFTIELWKSQIEARISSAAFKPDIDFLWLDGIPRNVEQAQMLEPFCEVLKVFHLSCPNRDELARRIRKRALKQNRLDDANEAVIQKRFEIYDNESKPILEHYGDRAVHIDASQSPVKILNDILTEIMALDCWKELSRMAV
ncbi:MAG: adenylate kinase [Verrucomicrobia bacterium]|jgi:adenylate kinase|nr:MAG: adenylate kinase [Verrucomicrobiota bacterium]